jgi:hypothetical protein
VQLIGNVVILMATVRLARDLSGASRAR